MTSNPANHNTDQNGNHSHEMEDFSDAAVESLNDDLHTEDVEAFEGYIHNLRGHIKDHLPNFSDRFLEGYKAIVKQLQTPPSEEKE